MPHIPLEDHLPGITGLLEYSKATAQPIRELTQFLLRGPSSLTEGKALTSELVAIAREAGATDVEIHDAVLIAAAFCMFNRYVDRLGTTAPLDRQFYINRAPQRAEDGYLVLR